VEAGKTAVCGVKLLQSPLTYRTGVRFRLGTRESNSCT